MSKHPSYGKSTKGATKRNVLKRYERVHLLKEREHWKGRQSVLGLPKTRVTV